MSFAKDSTSIPKPPPRWWWRWGRRLLLGVLGCVIVAALTYGHYRHRWAEELRAAMADLDRSDPGWRLADLEAARAVVPDDENSAPVVRGAAQQLPHDLPMPITFERFNGLAPQQRLGDVEAAALRDELAAMQIALEKAREIAALPRGRHPIIYERNVFDTRLPHADDTRRVLWLLQLDVLNQTHAGDMRGALRSCRAFLNTARSIGDEPLLVCQLVRMAGVGLTAKLVERVFDQGEPDADDLLVLQQLLQDEERFPRLVVGQRGERAQMQHFLEALESGDVTLAEFAGLPASWPYHLTDFVDRDYVRSWHAAVLGRGRRKRYALPPCPPTSDSRRPPFSTMKCWACRRASCAL